MCEGNCKCKDKEIKTVYVEKDWGEQMMFAVPPDGMNVNDSVSVVDEIWKEIDDYLIRESDDIRMGIEDVKYLRRLRNDIKNIFNKYSK